MTDPWKELQQLFVDDHRDMIRGFRRLLLAVRAEEDGEAARLADELDLLAGPHIAFEERHLYPLVRRQRGAEYADRLYHEHHVMLEGLRVLQALEAGGKSAQLSEADRQAVTEQLEMGLQHAATCGSLLSHLQALPADVQLDLLEVMRGLRHQTCRWTQLTRSPGATG